MNPTRLGAGKLDAVIDHEVRQDGAIARMYGETSMRSDRRGTAVVDFETEGEKQ